MSIKTSTPPRLSAAAGATLSSPEIPRVAEKAHDPFGVRSSSRDMKALRPRASVALSAAKNLSPPQEAPTFFRSLYIRVPRGERASCAGYIYELLATTDDLSWRTATSALMSPAVENALN